MQYRQIAKEILVSLADAAPGSFERIAQSKFPWLSKWAASAIRIRRVRKTQFPRYYLPKESFGTAYGGWTIPINFLNANSVVYLVGAGEDISFDVSIARKYKCRVNIFDPTPRARTHFEKLASYVSSGGDFPFAEHLKAFYSIHAEEFKKLHFHPYGIWHINDSLRFYAPKNSQHVSHSLLNLQKTQQYFDAQVKDLLTIMRELEHQKIDLLKIDIEGAEYEVLKSILSNKIRISIICCEYDEHFYRLDGKYLDRIRDSVDSLQKSGYVVIDQDSQCNFTFVRRVDFPHLRLSENTSSRIL